MSYEDPPRPTRRTISVLHYEPWLLGWCRWAVTTTLHFDDRVGHTSILASGRWKWRGRHADCMEATADASLDFYGPPIEVVA